MKKLVRVLAGLMACIMIGSCSTGNVPQLMDPVGVNVDTATVTKEEMYELESFNSAVVPYVESVFFTCSGKVLDSRVVLGQTVKKGDVLATLDTVELKKQIQQVEDQLEFNRKNNVYTNEQMELSVELAKLRIEQLRQAGINPKSGVALAFFPFTRIMQTQLAVVTAETPSEVTTSQETASSEISSGLSSNENSSALVGSVALPEEESKLESTEESEEAPEVLEEPEEESQKSSTEELGTEEAPVEVPPVDPVTKAERVLAQAELDAARLALSQAKEMQDLERRQLTERLSTLRDSLGETQIIAPFSGKIVYESGVQMGDEVQAFIPVFCVSDETRLSLSGDVIGVGKVRQAGRVTARIEGKNYPITYREYPADEYAALVLSGSEVPACFDIQGTTRGLKSGQYACIYVYSGLVEEALTIPSNALLGDYSTGYYVYLMENEKPVRRSVTVGTKNPARVQIKEGLKEGELVYVQG